LKAGERSIPQPGKKKREKTKTNYPIALKGLTKFGAEQA
jgi:hypothetical protein